VSVTVARDNSDGLAGVLDKLGHANGGQGHGCRDVAPRVADVLVMKNTRRENDERKGKEFIRGFRERTKQSILTLCAFPLPNLFLNTRCLGLTSKSTLLSVSSSRLSRI
jgi:hypothetical protein